MLFEIDEEHLARLFHLKRKHACMNLNCGATQFKKICREHNIKRWPSRQIAPLRKYILLLVKLKETNDNVLIDEYLRYLEYIKTSIFNDTELKLKDFISNLPRYINTLMFKLNKP